MKKMVSALRFLWHSGIWAPLAASGLFLVAIQLQSWVLLVIGWSCMCIAPLYVGFFCGDAKRAKEKQARIHSKR